MGDKFSDAGNAIRDFLAGIGDSLVGTVKGLLTLVVDLGLLYVHSECSRMTLGHVPETLDQEVEKIKQKYEPLLKDPVNTIGGIGQSICDTADEKGVAYSSGYIVTEVVTALLADKGLDKIKNVAKTGKTADNVADIAEGAAKGAGNAAEDAGKAGKGLEEAAKGAESAAEDAGKAGKGLEGAAKGAESAAEDAGKVVESGTDSWNMVEGGGTINGREYSQHAMERMAPDTPQVRAELSRRAEKSATQRGLKVGTQEYYEYCKKYVDPRNIPPSVIEDAISSTKGIPGNRPDTFIHETADVKIVINSAGKVITVIPK